MKEILTFALSYCSICLVLSDLRHSKLFYFYFCKSIEKLIHWNIYCKECCMKLWKRNNTWNIRHLVNESFVPATQQPSDPATQRPSLLYWSLSDFYSWLILLISDYISSKNISQNLAMPPTQVPSAARGHMHSGLIFYNE